MAVFSLRVTASPLCRESPDQMGGRHGVDPIDLNLGSVPEGERSLGHPVSWGGWGQAIGLSANRITRIAFQCVEGCLVRRAPCADPSIESVRKHVQNPPDTAGILALLRLDRWSCCCRVGAGRRRRGSSAVGSTHPLGIAGNR